MNTTKIAVLAGMMFPVFSALAQQAGATPAQPPEPTWWVTAGSFVLSTVVGWIFTTALDDWLAKHRAKRTKQPTPPAPAVPPPPVPAPASPPSTLPECCCTITIQVFAYVGFLLASSGVALLLTSFSSSVSIRWFGQSFVYSSLLVIGLFITTACHREATREGEGRE